MYNDDKYVKEYLTNGKYPKIHDDIAVLIRGLPKNSVVLDVGCSTGLLTQRMLDMGLKCYGIDIDAEAVSKANQHCKVMDIRSLASVERYIIDNNINAAVCRRVLPEIMDTGVLFDFIGVMSRHIEWIIVEGRIESARSTHTLKNIDEEIRALSVYYKLIKRYKRCAIMKIK